MPTANHVTRLLVDQVKNPPSFITMQNFVPRHIQYVGVIRGSQNRDGGVTLPLDWVKVDHKTFFFI